MTYGMDLWCPAKRGANMTVVLTRAASLISGIHRDASRSAFFMDGSVNQDVMLAHFDGLSADDQCRMARGRQCSRQDIAAIAAALYAHNDPCSPVIGMFWSAVYVHRTTWELLFGMACTTGMPGTASCVRAICV